MVDFRFKRPDGERHPATQATSFVFLGFLHVWGKSRRGKNVVYQRTAKDRYARALRSIHLWCRANRHWPLAKQHTMLARKMRGHYAYYGISWPGERAVGAFAGIGSTRSSIATRSLRPRLSTATPPRAKRSREEPDAVVLHVRICEGRGR
jgi:hypothetical protein